MNSYIFGKKKREIVLKAKKKLQHLNATNKTTNNIKYKIDTKQHKSDIYRKKKHLKD